MWKPQYRNNFVNREAVLSSKQPPNLLQHLSKAKFTSNRENHQQNELFKCSDIRCKFCRLYIQDGDSFITANGYTWKIKCHITCHSKNVLYYLKCSSCKGNITYTGKTDDLRLRMDNHITGCRHGNSTDVFDNHVHACKKDNNHQFEPYFLIHVFMEINDERQLITYEEYLHNRGFDTMNSPK